MVGRAALVTRSEVAEMVFEIRPCWAIMGGRPLEMGCRTRETDESMRVSLSDSRRVGDSMRVQDAEPVRCGRRRAHGPTVQVESSTSKSTLVQFFPRNIGNRSSINSTSIHFHYVLVQCRGNSPNSAPFHGASSCFVNDKDHQFCNPLIRSPNS